MKLDINFLLFPYKPCYLSCFMQTKCIDNLFKYIFLFDRKVFLYLNVLKEFHCITLYNSSYFNLNWQQAKQNINRVFKQKEFTVSLLNSNCIIYFLLNFASIKLPAPLFVLLFYSQWRSQPRSGQYDEYNVVLLRENQSVFSMLDSTIELYNVESSRSIGNFPCCI